MSTQVQYRRGTATQNNAFVGALAEITVDTTNKTLRVHDGSTAGGSNIATVAYVDNAISSLSANSITDGTSSVSIIATNGNIRANVGGSTVTNIYSSGLAVTGLMSASGNVTGGNILTGGVVSATGNVTGGNILTGGLISATGTVTGTTFVGAVASGTTVSATGNITGGNILTAGLISAAGTVTGTTFVGVAQSATTAGTVTTAAQGNITSVGTLTSLNVTGNISGGNLSGTSIVGTLTTAAQTNITSVGTLTSLSVSGNVQGGNLRTAGLISATGNVTGTTFVGAVASSTTVSATGNITGGNILTGGLISAAGTVTGTTFVGIANQAKYADLAEYYIADANYPVGTVLQFGGNAEVTQSSSSHVTSIAGTVSDKPAYIMNSDLDHDHKTPVALIGRVPCRVVGLIQKGDRLVASSISGVATVLDPDLYEPGCILGKALENYNSTEPGVIEIVVGRL